MPRSYPDDQLDDSFVEPQNVETMPPPPQVRRSHASTVRTVPAQASTTLAWLSDSELERWLLSNSAGQTISRGGAANSRMAEDLRDLVGVAADLGRILGEGEPREVRIRSLDDRTLISRRRNDGTRLTIVTAPGADTDRFLNAMRSS